MPIIEVPDQASPLTQGDLMKGIAVLATSFESRTGSIIPVARTCAAALIISRACATLHKPTVLVAEVESYKEARPSECQTFDDVLDFLTDYRDGWDTPDRFYLGQIPSLGPGRFRAKLDAIHTVILPPPAEMTKFNALRVGRLSSDFARDLHVRLFRAFASMGFDDERWFADGDLDWLLSVGNQELAAAQAQLASGVAGGFKNSSHEKSLSDAVQKLQQRLRPLLEEKATRRTANSAATPPSPTKELLERTASPFSTESLPESYPAPSDPT